MRRCPDCRAILGSGPCPFCGGEPQAELVELAKAAGTPDPERFAEGIREEEARTARPVRPSRAASASAVLGRPASRGGIFGSEEDEGSGHADAIPGPRRVSGAVPVEGRPSPSFREPEIAEERVTRHDEPIGFQRSATVQGVIVLLVVVFFVGLILWFWN